MARSYRGLDVVTEGQALRPSVCRYEHFLTEWYAKWATRLAYPVEVVAGPVVSYRKVWEFAAILETLEQNGLLCAGKKGLGFAVGREPLPSIMAAAGVDIVATDLMPDRVSSNWTETSQHATGLDAIHYEWLIDRATFEQRVRFEHADMTDLSTLSGEYDFLWSSCALEHLGTLDRGLDFVVAAMRLLKPGGLAVHTTEFNVSSNDATIAEGNDCIYRRRDIQQLDGRLRLIGCGLEPIDFEPGTHHHDLAFDRAPYYHSGYAHIKLEIAGFICTSMLMVARKA
jgi:2-polyprenyl-3-methyl-5-hydroxy-6-metoxy-1,4-benzoquinol methylase